MSYKKEKWNNELQLTSKQDNVREGFLKRIQTERDMEEERLLNLQKKYEQDNITEDEISENDKLELKGMYYMQMLKSKIKIKRYKEKIENKA